MEKEKLVREDVIEYILEGLGVSKIKKYEVDLIVRLFFNFIQEAMKEGHRVELRGFGLFYVERLKATIKVIPASKLKYPGKKYIEIKVKERKTVKFIPSTLFKSILNPDQENIDEIEKNQPDQ